MSVNKNMIRHAIGHFWSRRFCLTPPAGSFYKTRRRIKLLQVARYF